MQLFLNKAFIDTIKLTKLEETALFYRQNKGLIFRALVVIYIYEGELALV